MAWLAQSVMLPIFPTLKPLQDYILVKPYKRLQSGIIEVIGGEKFSRGTVIAIGPGERLTKRYHEGGNRWRTEETGIKREMQVKPGDTIVYGDGTLDYMYPRWFEGNEEYRVLQEKDVCFVLEGSTGNNQNEAVDKSTL